MFTFPKQVLNPHRSSPQRDDRQANTAARQKAGLPDKGLHLNAMALAFAAAASATALSPGVAQAQPVLQEITVTAQKRAQNIQDVPIAVSAFSPEMLADKGISDVSQLSNLTPNVTLDASTPFSGSSFVLAGFIRGIGQNDFAFNFDPGVGIYVDGVYYARTVGANVDLLDVERVEILKGPQGTLFGRNTIGGAVNIVTRQPGDEFAFQGEVSSGRYNRFDVRGSVDLPLSENWKSAVAFSTKNRQGFQKRVPFPAEAPFANDPVNGFNAAGFESSQHEGGQGEWNVRGKLRFDSGTNVRWNFVADYTNVDQSASASSLLATTSNVPGPFADLAENNIPGTALNPFPNPNGFLFAGLYNFCINSTPAEIAGRNAQTVCGVRGIPNEARPAGVAPSAVRSSIASVNVDDNPDNDRLPFDDRFVSADPDISFATGNSFARLEAYGFSSTLDWDFAENVSLKSITAFRNLKWETGLDPDGSPLQTLEPSFFTTQDQFSQEFQLTGRAFDSLDYVVGTYYFHEDGNLTDFVTFPVGLLQVFGPNDLNTDTWAIFSHLNYQLTDRLSFTLGGRFTKEYKQFQGSQSDLNGFNFKLFNLPVNSGTAAALGFPIPEEPVRFFPELPNDLQKRNFNDFSGRVGLEYRPLEDIMVYTSYSEGFKSGGWTTRLSNPINLETNPDFADQLTFDPERARTIELGLKSEFFNRRLQVNAAGFYTDYNNIVLNFQIGISPTFRNAGNAEIYGFEIESQAAITESFRLTANAGYINAEYTSIDPGAVGITLDSELPKTPEFKFSIGPQYELSLRNQGSILFNLDYTHSSSVFNDAENTALLRRPSTGIVNVSVTYRDPLDKWEAVLGGSNITDERYLVTGQAQVAGGQIYGTFNRPAEWYATLRMHY
ncbi:MAG: TonB-dependent receptor [Pseudomonadales bacterium]|nr:TonB-dependent receptor [Pseudomonadales bacterium]